MLAKLNLVLFACWVVLGLSGCGKDPLPPLHPVKGRVMNGSKTVSGGQVRLVLDNEQKVMIINGTVGPDGSFEISTQVDNTKGPGAPAGTYKAIYHPPLGDQTQGGQTFEPSHFPGIIVEERANELVLDLTKKK